MHERAGGVVAAKKLGRLGHLIRQPAMYFKQLLTWGMSKHSKVTINRGYYHDVQQGRSNHPLGPKSRFVRSHVHCSSKQLADREVPVNFASMCSCCCEGWILAWTLSAADSLNLTRFRKQDRSCNQAHTLPAEQSRCLLPDGSASASLIQAQPHLTAGVEPCVDVMQGSSWLPVL